MASNRVPSSLGEFRVLGGWVTADGRRSTMLRVVAAVPRSSAERSYSAYRAAMARSCSGSQRTRESRICRLVSLTDPHADQDSRLPAGARRMQARNISYLVTATD